MITSQFLLGSINLKRGSSVVAEALSVEVWFRLLVVAMVVLALS
jgi:hypothetical protein